MVYQQFNLIDWRWPHFGKNAKKWNPLFSRNKFQPYLSLFLNKHKITWWTVSRRGRQGWVKIYVPLIEPHLLWNNPELSLFKSDYRYTKIWAQKYSVSYFTIRKFSNCKTFLPLSMSVTIFSSESAMSKPLRSILRQKFWVKKKSNKTLKRQKIFEKTAKQATKLNLAIKLQQ